MLTRVSTIPGLNPSTRTIEIETPIDTVVRNSSVDASFRKLGIEKLSIRDIQRLKWETLEMKIRRWIRVAKLCVRVLFASEKKLCEQVFEGLGTATDDACFMEIIKGPAIQFFNFTEAISIIRWSAEKLFKILDLHDVVHHCDRAVRKFGGEATRVIGVAVRRRSQKWYCSCSRAI
ncbi:PREDICTED: exocyst complex component EXO70B1-like [Ipomoea nil]|uniref:exocyst complex component EXO70B1-like n=1 Tax=Ipomoea nil TaxID=35883 RepID=UPI0009011B44|nr:PREDICTED: exocyst complex component EXO70B1-like [Ipomoea nil]